MLLIGTAAGIIAASVSESSAVGKPATAHTSTVATTKAPPVAPHYDVPSTDNLVPELTVTEKSCYGSAGCNFKYELQVSASRPVTFDPAKTYRVTVVVDEGTSWERIHSLKVTGDQTSVPSGSLSSDTHDTPVPRIQAIAVA
ncbi:hypothetical protein ACWF9G_28990 [Nocardia sp. NPDC055029]